MLKDRKKLGKNLTHTQACLPPNTGKKTDTVTKHTASLEQDKERQRLLGGSFALGLCNRPSLYVLFCTF